MDDIHQRELESSVDLPGVEYTRLDLVLDLIYPWPVFLGGVLVVAFFVFV
jgi:hypothetical protein